MGMYEDIFKDTDFGDIKDPKEEAQENDMAKDAKQKDIWHTGQKPDIWSVDAKKDVWDADEENDDGSSTCSGNCKDEDCEDCDDDEEIKGLPSIGGSSRPSISSRKVPLKKLYDPAKSTPSDPLGQRSSKRPQPMPDKGAHPIPHGGGAFDDIF